MPVVWGARSPVGHRGPTQANEKHLIHGIMAWERRLHSPASMKRSPTLLVAAVFAAACAAGCSSHTSASPSPAPAAQAPAAQAPADHAQAAPFPADYVPAEFKLGASRWKDTGLYVDGKAFGILVFGELPAALEPVWVEQEVSRLEPPKEGPKALR